MSTTQAILKLVNDNLKYFSDKKISCVLFIDYSKAFDMVDYRLLIKKLYKYGVRGLTLELVKSYLSDRQHFTSIDGIFSSKLELVIGVPQGS